MKELRTKALEKIRAYLDYMKQASKNNAPISTLGDLYNAACGKIRMAQDLGLINSYEATHFINIAADISAGQYK